MAFDAIVIGTGFGGTIAAVQLVAQGKSVLLLERGTFWRSPYPLPLSQGDPFGDWAHQNNMPVQYWPRPDHRKGMTDFVAAIRNLNKDGLYQYSMFHQADVLTASGVGGGSLIYSNVSIRPRDEALARIGLNLGDAEYAAARLWMEGVPADRPGANRGWFNFVASKVPMPGMTAAQFQALGVDPVTHEDTNPSYALLDRTRVLRKAARDVSAKLGVPMEWAPLELSLTEYDAERAGASDSLRAHTHCERQGRCILGCVPQARHTLNKTLFKKILKNPAVTLQPQCKVLGIAQKPGGYEVTYDDRRNGKNGQTAFAPKVFLAAVRPEWASSKCEARIAVLHQRGLRRLCLQNQGQEWRCAADVHHQGPHQHLACDDEFQRPFHQDRGLRSPIIVRGSGLEGSGDHGRCGSQPQFLPTDESPVPVQCGRASHRDARPV
jgi:choline dehydrogenase-like flavoprotein